MQLTEHQLSSLFRITFRPLQNAGDLNASSSPIQAAVTLNLSLTRKANTMAGETLSVVSPGSVKASDLNAEFVLRQTANTPMC